MEQYGTLYIYNKRRLSWYQIMEIQVWMTWIIILTHKWQLQDPWGPNLGSKDYVDCKELKKCNIKIIQWKCNWIWPEVSFWNVFSSFYKLHHEGIWGSNPYVGSKFDIDYRFLMKFPGVRQG
jgi:hypothetical protein